MPELKLGQFAPVGVGYTGAVKIGLPALSTGCCDCNSDGLGSAIAIYTNGAPTQLWYCQGCLCNQIDINSSVSLADGAPVALYPGAVAPDDCCARCCYSLQFDPDTNTGDLAADYDNAISIKAVAMDNIANGIILERVNRELDAARKAAEAAIAELEALKGGASSSPGAPGSAATGDPFADFLRGFATCI